MKIRLSSVAGAALLAATVAACGDPATTDDRGYTKAPLEKPGWVVTGEEPTEMDALGDPIRVPALESDSATGEGAAPSSTAQPAATPASDSTAQ